MFNSFVLQLLLIILKNFIINIIHIYHSILFISLYKMNDIQMNNMQYLYFNQKLFIIFIFKILFNFHFFQFEYLITNLIKYSINRILNFLIIMYYFINNDIINEMLILIIINENMYFNFILTPQNNQD